MGVVGACLGACSPCCLGNVVFCWQEVLATLPSGRGVSRPLRSSIQLASVSSNYGKVDLLAASHEWPVDGCV